METAKNPVQSYRDLRVWQEGMTLSETCYRHHSLLTIHDARLGSATDCPLPCGPVPTGVADRGSDGYNGKQMALKPGTLGPQEVRSHAAE